MEVFPLAEQGWAGFRDFCFSKPSCGEVDRKPVAEQVLLKAGTMSTSEHCNGDAKPGTFKERYTSRGCAIVIARDPLGDCACMPDRSQKADFSLLKSMVFLNFEASD